MVERSEDDEWECRGQKGRLEHNKVKCWMQCKAGEQRRGSEGGSEGGRV